MNEYILKVKDYEGEVLELKTFANNIMEVIDNMVALHTIEAIETVTRVSDKYLWNIDRSLTPLKEIKKEMDNAGLTITFFEGDENETNNNH
ncbi:MAG: hypothetical protein CML44_00550 [Rhodobacteraceae bacterium]|nr:hypothetical protein [Paracoccaceae bacterium]